MENIIKQYDILQKRYGSKDLHSVYGYGCSNKPKVALVFMNPTKKNVATSPSWAGIRAQWLGTKQIWDFLTKCGLFDETLNAEIKAKKPIEWTYDFCTKVYDVVTKNKVWITNLAKCSQDDARPLPDSVFLQYKDLLKQELKIVDPDVIFLFGNQVSSIMLEDNITVSTCRQKEYTLSIDDTTYPCYSIYYPVGNGRFNQPKAIEDIKDILGR